MKDAFIAEYEDDLGTFAPFRSMRVWRIMVKKPHMMLSTKIKTAWVGL